MWWKFSSDVAVATFEAQRVIALRLMKLAAGGLAAQQEARKMVSEKMAACAEAAATLAGGGSMDTVVRRYRTIMRANEKRLSAAKGNGDGSDISLSGPASEIFCHCHRSAARPSLM